jgi:hypothetical protein
MPSLEYSNCATTSKFAAWQCGQANAVLSPSPLRRLGTVPLVMWAEDNR